MISYYDVKTAQHAMRTLQNTQLRTRKLDIHYSTPKVFDVPNNFLFTQFHFHYNDLDVIFGYVIVSNNLISCLGQSSKGT